MPEETKEMPVCPKCEKNDQVVYIAYGYPGYEMIEKAENGEIHLGGCVIGEEKFYCNRDNISF